MRVYDVFLIADNTVLVGKHLQEVNTSGGQLLKGKDCESVEVKQSMLHMSFEEETKRLTGRGEQQK